MRLPKIQELIFRILKKLHSINSDEGADEIVKDNDTINSIDRALDILLFLQRAGREQGVTQIGTGLGMYKSTVHRTLNTLENRGFVQQNPDNGKYWLGMRLYSLGMLLKEKMPLAKIVHPYAKVLSERFKEGVHISVLDKNAEGYPKHILIEKVESQQVLSLTPPTGSSAPCHCSAVGKCLLAFSPPGYLERFVGGTLPAYTEKTIVQWDKLLDEMQRIRIKGYAVDEEELELGLFCVAAPILTRGQEALAALSLSGPTSRMKSGRFEEMVEAIQETAKTISELI